MPRRVGRSITVRVPLLDLSAIHADLADDLIASLRSAIDSGSFIGGQEVEAFESEWAGYCEAAGAVGVANGTDALQLVLRAAGIGTGDEVITPAMTFVATVEAVRLAGADPVLVDVDERTGLLDLRAAAAAIGPRTAAIVPVHLWGQPVDMDAVSELASRHGLFVLEDAAQAHGARWRGKRAGSLGDAAGFSMYPGKNLGALGDAGAVTGNDPALLAKLRSISNHGRDSKHDHRLLGTNSRLDAIQAAFLRCKLPYLDRWNELRREHASAYRRAFSASRLVTAIEIADEAEAVYHHFVVRVAGRDQFAAKLQSKGISCGIHYPRAIHENTAFSDLARVGSLPAAERLTKEIISLPIGPELSERQIEAVSRALVEVC